MSESGRAGLKAGFFADMLSQNLTQPAQFDMTVSVHFSFRIGRFVVKLGALSDYNDAEIFSPLAWRCLMEFTTAARFIGFSGTRIKSAPPAIPP